MESNVEKIELFKDESNKWRWRAVAKNEKGVSTSGENFAEKNNASEAAERVHPGVRQVVVSR